MNIQELLDLVDRKPSLSITSNIVGIRWRESGGFTGWEKYILNPASSLFDDKRDTPEVQLIIALSRANDITWHDCPQEKATRGKPIDELETAIELGLNLGRDWATAFSVHQNHSANGFLLKVVRLVEAAAVNYGGWADGLEEKEVYWLDVIQDVTDFLRRNAGLNEEDQLVNLADELPYYFKQK